MRLRFLLDTDVLSEPMRRVPDAALMRQLELHESELAIPAPAWTEIRFGWLRMPEGRRRDVVGILLDQMAMSAMPVLAYDRACAEWHAAERARLESRGARPPFVDGQIAAIAAVHELTLVTRNGRDYKPFRGIQLATWHASARA